LTLILLALLCHTSSTCCTPNTSNSAEPWQRAAPFLMISVRSPGYWAFDSWEQWIAFMICGLELEPPPT
jgi:hypothetical protein